MDESEQDCRYWAFISYSHQDRAWGNWLHRAIETYRVPRRLVGRKTAMGTIPRRLFPVFCDRDELPSAANLGDAINESLQASRFQLVICSPRAAQSKWVNAEVRYFKSLGRESRVLCVIVDGEPGAAERECFPETLRHAVHSDGTLGAPVELIAADARASGDGREHAKLKLIAGMLGVGFDELKQREQQRRFWQRVQQGVAALLVAASLLGAWQWFEHYKQAQALQQRIETVYERGRLALLDQQAGRAAVYLNEAYRLGWDTPALRFMLARAMETVSAIHRFDRGATGYISRPVFSPDDRQFATPVVADGSTVATLRDTATGVVLQTLKGLPAYPQIVRYLPDAKRLLVSGYAESSPYGTRGAETGVWDVASGERLLSLSGGSGHFGTPISDDGRLLVTAGADGDANVQLCDAATGAVLRGLPHATPATAASLSGDGRWVVTGDAEGRVRLWDAATGRLQKMLPGQTATAIVAALITPDATRILAVSRKGDVRVWGLAIGELQLAFSADKSYVADLRFDARGQRVLTIGRQGYKVWDLARGILLFARNLELDWQGAGDLDASGNFLAIASTDDSRAELWDVPSRRRLSLIEFEPQAVTAAVFNHVGKALLLGGETGGAAMVSPLPGPELTLAQPPSVYGAEFSPDGQRIATVGYDHLLRLWDATAGAVLATGVGHTQRVLQVLYSTDGERLITTADDHTLKIWRAADAQLLASAAVPGSTRRLLLSPDDQQVLMTSYDAETENYSASLWNARSARLLHVLQHKAVVQAGRFSPDGLQVATGSNDGELRFWSRQTGALLIARKLSDSALIGLRYSPDGKRLLVVDAEHGAAVMDVLSGSILSRLVLSEGDAASSVGAVALSSDGSEWALGTNAAQIWTQTVGEADWGAVPPKENRLWELRYLTPPLLLSSSWDGSLRAWDTCRAQELAVVGGHDGVAWTMAVDAEGERLLSAGLDGTARVWRVGTQLPDSATLTREIRCKLPLRLTANLQLQKVQAPRCD